MVCLDVDGKQNLGKNDINLHRCLSLAEEKMEEK